MPPWHVARGGVKVGWETRAFAPPVTPRNGSGSTQFAPFNTLLTLCCWVFQSNGNFFFFASTGCYDPRSLATNTIALGRPQMSNI